MSYPDVMEGETVFSYQRPSAFREDFLEMESWTPDTAIAKYLARYHVAGISRVIVMGTGNVDDNLQ